MDNRLVGWGAAALAAVLALGMPVSGRRVNQPLISILIIVLCFVAAFALFEGGSALAAGAAASLGILILRAIVRFVRHATYDLTKYARRDYWYRRMGRALLDGRRRRR